MTVVCGFVNTSTVTSSLRTFTVAPEASMMELTCGLFFKSMQRILYRFNDNNITITN